MREAQGFAYFGAVFLHVCHAQQAGVVGVLLHTVDDGLCQRAGVESVYTFLGDQLVNLGQTGIRQAMADRQRCAIGFEKVGDRLRVFEQRGFVFQERMQSRADGET